MKISLKIIGFLSCVFLGSMQQTHAGLNDSQQSWVGWLIGKQISQQHVTNAVYATGLGAYVLINTALALHAVQKLNKNSEKTSPTLLQKSRIFFQEMLVGVPRLTLKAAQSAYQTFKESRSWHEWQENEGPIELLATGLGATISLSAATFPFIRAPHAIL